MEVEQKIAKVRSSFIGFEDHGFLTVTLGFDYGGAGQGLATRGFGSSSEKPDRADAWAIAHARGMDFIRRLLLACGVDRWEHIVGRTVLVTATWTDITRIDPLPTERGEGFDITAWSDEQSAVAA